MRVVGIFNPVLLKHRNIYATIKPLKKGAYIMGFLGTLLFNIKNMKKAKKFRTMSKEVLLSLSDEDFFDAIECLCEDAVYDIKSPDIPEEQKLVYSLNKFEAEVNNGGLCQFFVNSSRECAPYISTALEAIGEHDIKALYDSFIINNKIDVNDLSSFIITSIDEFEAQTKRYDFDSFDDNFYENEAFHHKIIDYSRKNIEILRKA